MFKLIQNKVEEENIIPMNEMKPWDIGEIVSDLYRGEVVMRTASREKREVMRLSNPNPDYWNTSYEGTRDHKVKLFPKGTRITLEVI